MQITEIGYILFLLGLYAFFFNRKFLYDLVIFFVPFSATAVINIGSGENASAIQPYMFFSSLWIFSLFLDSIIKRKQLKIDRREYKPLFYLILFSIIALLSLIMPIYIDGSELGNISGKLDEEEYIRFSSRNVTQYIYLLLGILFSICIYKYNKNIENYRHTIKIVYYSILFIIIWGFIEYLFKSMGIPPIDVLNNSAHGSSQGYLSVAADDRLRIASVAVEASVFNQVVILILPFIIWAILDKRYIINRKMDYLYLVLAFIAIVLSASSSGLLAIVMLGFTIFMFKQKSLSLSRKIVYTIIFSLFAIAFVLFFMLFFNDLIQTMILDKSDSYSAMERLGNVIQAWNNFIDYPLLGVGWGSVTSMDLIVKILSNTGIIGGFVFISYLVSIFKNLWRQNSSLLVTENLKNPITTTFILLIFFNIITGFSFIFGHSWLYLGLTMISVPIRKSQHFENI